MSSKQISVKSSEIKLFNKWSYRGIEVRDPSLKKYIGLRPVYVPHTGGRHEHRRFEKGRVPIVERLVNKLMSPGKNTGKKQLTINIVKQAFEIIHVRLKENPIQVLVRAVENAAPREETTTIMYGGIMYHVSVDVAPLRRVDLALRYMVEGARNCAFNNPMPIEECLANEIIAAATNDPKSYAISKKEEIERIALSSR